MENTRDTIRNLNNECIFTNNGENELTCPIGRLVYHYITLVPDLVKQYGTIDDIYMDRDDFMKCATKSFIERA